MSEPDFNAWLDYAFTRGHADFERMLDIPEPWASLSPEQITRLFIRLFENPSALDRFNCDQIASGLWYLFGIASESTRVAGDPSVPVALRLRWLRGLPGLYEAAFDPRCLKPGDTQPDQQDPLYNAVYMLWDMTGGLASACDTPDIAPLDLDIELCAAVLARCHSTACLMSALHALGHSREYAGVDSPKAARASQAIDAFLKANPDLPPHIRQYAELARDADCFL